VCIGKARVASQRAKLSGYGCVSWREHLKLLHIYRSMSRVIPVSYRFFDLADGTRAASSGWTHHWYHSLRAATLPNMAPIFPSRGARGGMRNTRNVTPQPARRWLLAKGTYPSLHWYQACRQRQCHQGYQRLRQEKQRGYQEQVSVTAFAPSSGRAFVPL